VCWFDRPSAAGDGHDDEEASCDGVRGAVVGGGGRRRRVRGVVQRRAAGGVRGGADVGRQALDGVLLQPQGAAGLLLPVRKEPRIQPLHQQPQRAQGGRSLRRRTATLQLASYLNSSPSSCLYYPS